MKIGVIGLGKLGQAIGERLLERGFDLRAWNRTSRDEAALASLAGHTVETLEVLAATSDVLVIVVRDDAALTEVTQTLASGDLSGKTVVQMSTVHPDTSITVGATLAKAGATFVEAPVSGTVGPAREGKLLILAGGEADDLERVAPVLNALGRRIAHMGRVGKGSLMKLVINQVLGVYWEALSEALAVGQAGGLEVAPMLDALMDSSVGLPMLAGKRGLVEGQGGAVAFDLAGVRKDQLLMERLARELGLPTPATASTLAMVTAATAAGYGDRDVAELTRFWLDAMIPAAGRR